MIIFSESEIRWVSWPTSDVRFLSSKTVQMCRQMGLFVFMQHASLERVMFGEAVAVMFTDFNFRSKKFYLRKV